MRSKKHRENQRAGRDKAADRFMRKIEVVRKAKQAKLDREVAEYNAEIDRLNHLPIGASENRYKLENTFGPIEKFLQQIVETCEFDVLASDGTAVFQTEWEKGRWWPVVDSFLAMCDVYELAAADLKIDSHTKGIRQLANKVDHGMMLFQSDIDMAQASINWMREITAAMTPIEFSKYTGMAIAKCQEANERALDRKDGAR